MAKDKYDGTVIDYEKHETGSFIVFMAFIIGAFAFGAFIGPHVHDFINGVSPTERNVILIDSDGDNIEGAEYNVLELMREGEHIENMGITACDEYTNANSMQFSYGASPKIDVNVCVRNSRKVNGISWLYMESTANSGNGVYIEAYGELYQGDKFVSEILFPKSQRPQFTLLPYKTHTLKFFGYYGGEHTMNLIEPTDD